MNEHVIPMFKITRKEILRMIDKKLKTAETAKETVQRVLDEDAKIHKQKEALKNAIKVIDDAVEAACFFRDHLDDDVAEWKVSAQQLREIKVSLGPIEVDETALRFSINPERDVSSALFDASKRNLRM